MGGTMKKKPITQRVHNGLIEVYMDFWTECPCRKKERIERLLKSSQITAKFQEKRFENFSLEDIPEIVREAYRKAMIYYSKFESIRKTPENWIFLSGNPGCGKTHLLMSIVNNLVLGGEEVLYFPFVEGFEEIKNDMKKEDLNKARLDKMKSVPVLFIDDLFKPPGKPTDYELKQMFNVLNHRYLEKIPTLISSELSISQLVGYDEGFGSRINEMTKDFRVIIKGGKELNYRLREES